MLVCLQLGWLTTNGEGVRGARELCLQAGSSGRKQPGCSPLQATIPFVHEANATFLGVRAGAGGPSADPVLNGPSRPWRRAAPIIHTSVRGLSCAPLHWRLC